VPVAAPVIALSHRGGHADRTSTGPTICDNCYPICTVDDCDGGDRTPGGSIVVGVGTMLPDDWNVGPNEDTGDAATIETPLLPSAFIFLPGGTITYHTQDWGLRRN